LLYEVNAHKGSILSVEHLFDQNLIATSSNDLTINFWDASSFNLKQILSVPEIQLCIRYANWKSANTQLLYTGGSDSIIHIYDAATLKERGTISGWNPFYRNDSQQFGHKSPIGDILPIDVQQTLVTAGYDGNICLWDSVTHLPKK
jgi:WD40 repeat protein